MEPISLSGSWDSSVSIIGSSVKVNMFDLLAPLGADSDTETAVTCHYRTWAQRLLLNLDLAARLRSASNPL
jgi:hypothetical protein